MGTTPPNNGLVLRPCDEGYGEVTGTVWDVALSALIGYVVCDGSSKKSAHKLPLTACYRERRDGGRSSRAVYDLA